MVCKTKMVCSLYYLIIRSKALWSIHQLPYFCIPQLWNPFQGRPICQDSEKVNAIELLGASLNRKKQGLLHQNIKVIPIFVEQAKLEVIGHSIGEARLCLWFKAAHDQSSTPLSEIRITIRITEDRQI